jgi:hypothetical protein
MEVYWGMENYAIATRAGRMAAGLAAVAALGIAGCGSGSDTGSSTMPSTTTAAVTPKSFQSCFLAKAGADLKPVKSHSAFTGLANSVRQEGGDAFEGTTPPEDPNVGLYAVFVYPDAAGARKSATTLGSIIGRESQVATGQMQKVFANHTIVVRENVALAFMGGLKGKLPSSARQALDSCATP